jgi:hypothetical protein
MCQSSVLWATEKTVSMNIYKLYKAALHEGEEDLFCAYQTGFSSVCTSSRKCHLTWVSLGLYEKFACLG